MVDETEIRENQREFYSNFRDCTEQFKKLPRAFCYDISTGLIEVAKIQSSGDWYTNEKTINSILLLLFCWDFSSNKKKRIRKKDIIELIESTENLLKKLNDSTIYNFDKEDEEIISYIYTSFKETLGQTGASKALSLLNPSLFLIWDTRIRKRLRGNIIKGIANGKNPEHYLSYLRGMREIIERLGLCEKIEKKEDIVKKINEFHYLKIVTEDEV